MWCSTCQQDVPGLGSPSSGGELRCGKCGGDLGAAERSKATSQASSNVTQIGAAIPNDNLALDRLLRCPPLPEDDWTLEAELRGVQRLLNSLRSRPPIDEAISLHVPQMALPGWHAGPPVEPSPDDDFETPDSIVPQPRANTTAWTIVSLSLAVFACGAVLLAWSLLGHREDLWPIGLPLALIGQAGLILGLVLHVEGLSRRRPAENAPPRRRRSRPAAMFSREMPQP